MKTILQESTTRIWGLSGLTGLVLMAGVLLEEGQARTYSPTPEHSSIQTGSLNRHAPHSESTKIVNRDSRNTSLEEKTNGPAIQKEGTDKNPAKKRMGLAILFLGILAEKG
ncbi:MAG: hypothetical protein WD032_04440 [Nitrospirales bacterium]